MAAKPCRAGWQGVGWHCGQGGPEPLRILNFGSIFGCLFSHKHLYLFTLATAVECWDHEKTSWSFSDVRIGNTHLTLAFLLKREDPLECIGCQTPLTFEHKLLNCIEFQLIRNKYYTSISTAKLLKFFLFFFLETGCQRSFQTMFNRNQFSILSKRWDLTVNFEF